MKGLKSELCLKAAGAPPRFEVRGLACRDWLSALVGDECMYEQYST